MPSEPVLAGMKRKRYTAVSEKDPALKLTGKLHHGLKELRKAAKKAKAFETQKVVKKLKDLRNPARNLQNAGGEISDLETQLECLKKIDQERIALIALASKIRKDKTLSSNDVLVAALASGEPSSMAHTNLGIWHVKVENRLLSSKFLSVEVGSVVDGLRAVMDSVPNIRTIANLMSLKSDGEDDVEEYAKAEFTSNHRNDMVEEADGTGRLDDTSEDGWQSGSIHNDDQSDSDEDDSTSSAPRHKRTRYLPSAQPEYASDSGEPEATSTFLPSLAEGFMPGNLDSDFEESDGDDAESGHGRKNRRGQRARQAIWEKKYGKNAKHVKKRQADSEAEAKAMKLGKRLDRGWAGHRQSLPSRSQISRASNPSHGAIIGNRTVEKPTHPSWEAKKKLKEKESAKILPSRGKKIVFS